MVGKANPNIPKAPLQPILIAEDPFSRVIIDCLGPLPKTMKGKQYIFSMCLMSRFPEAIPLRNISSKRIVEALMNFFLRSLEYNPTKGLTLHQKSFGRLSNSLVLKPFTQALIIHNPRGTRKIPHNLEKYDAGILYWKSNGVG